MKWQSTLFILGAIASQAFAGEDTIKCTINQEYARANRVAEGIDYLNGLSGQPTAEAGKCNRVSCAYGAGIYVCSDDGKDHTLKSWGTVADVSQKISDKCISGETINGRLHSSDGWGVIIQGASC
ncbi:uncharacterized protein N7469_007527 [Penicillium citrinum]|uniref:Uncharacterized protein n=2 Tax=Penicillium TaxID=5073 RepID=A0A9W9NWK9_PENCI|nr:uncharacterized protein N7469_007527 [Penicillium citrinum]KAJ5227521.1 hypothetical protein N7469_007527 [Penicillium citrinum]KAJ5568002.1 hypothetical protein N7450_010488 [Penicillium hetheringtonii]KAK5791756.1 hypothetical protein VI817_007065 [Penicillium citrinum]